ncbi:Zinc knuckle CX2CX4HX4C [Corchorus olitorius]|uniref:Zinc knuckle CX2CX4HX4C n=1 Tax=Corchorus olitorius TaxID=93759 RepID=A0A1R3KR20_9ROSI|nr:Zinc knuckle CX2CX4HX4C [Corchorus olitorius]
MRVGFDVCKPLVEDFWVPRKDKDKVLAGVKYERLADFCYICGRLGHVEKIWICVVSGIGDRGRKVNRDGMGGDSFWKSRNAWETSEDSKENEKFNVTKRLDKGKGAMKEDVANRRLFKSGILSISSQMFR